MTQRFRSRKSIRTTGDLKSSPELVFLLLEGFHLGSIAHSLYPVHYREPPGQNVTKTGSFQGINIYPRQNYQMHYCCRYRKIILLLAHHFDFEKLEHNFILIHVSWRSDGSESAPIILPHQEPFYLYPEHRTMKCQKVFGMRSSDQWIQYPHTQRDGGCLSSYYPYDENCHNDHKVHYCYYTSDTTFSITNVVG